MKIILLRHGKPDIDTGVNVSPHEYGDWLKVFNLAPVKGSAPTAAVTEMVRQCEFVVCSDLTRSIDSARALGIEQIAVTDPLFREFDVPYPDWSIPRLPATTWTVLFRLAWLVGYSANSESFKTARQRAVECMDRLMDYAAQHGTVLYVGHGALLWYLSRLLVKRGWRGSACPPRKHWAFCHYNFDRE